MSEARCVANEPVDETVNRFPLHWQFAVDKDYNLYIHANISGGLGDSDRAVIVRASFMA